MARVVKHDAQAPYEIPEGTELPIYICGCGLSKNKPYCDGSHKKTRAEAAGEVYEYDENGNAPPRREALKDPKTRCAPSSSLPTGRDKSEGWNTTLLPLLLPFHL